MSECTITFTVGHGYNLTPVSATVDVAIKQTPLASAAVHMLLPCGIS